MQLLCLNQRTIALFVLDWIIIMPRCLLAAAVFCCTAPWSQAPLNSAVGLAATVLGALAGKDNSSLRSRVALDGEACVIGI